MIVRNLTFADRLDEFPELGLFRLTPELTWVACDGPRVVGVLLAFAAHEVFAPFRLNVLAGAPYGCTLRLLRKAFSDAMKRGLKVFYVSLVTEDAVARRLLRILESRGNPKSIETFQNVFVAGPIAPLLALPFEPVKAVVNA